MMNPRLTHHKKNDGLNVPLHTFTGGSEPHDPEPNVPRQPEFLPPGEQQTTHSPAEGPRREMHSVPSTHEIPERPLPEVPQHTPTGPDRERA